MQKSTTKHKAFSSITVSYKASVVAQEVIKRSQRKEDKQRLRMRRKDKGRKERRRERYRIKRGGIRGQMGFEMLIRSACIFSFTGGTGNKNAGVEARLSVTLC